MPFRLLRQDILNAISTYTAIPDKQQARLELIDIAQIDAIDTRSERFKAFTDSLATASSLSADTKKNYMTVASALYGTQAEQELQKSMEMRNQAVCKYMSQQHGISDSMLTVIHASER